MNKEFDKFKQWLTHNYSDGLLDLNPPASDDEIKELTSTLGVELPEDFISVLKVHNGQKGEKLGFLTLKSFYQHIVLLKSIILGKIC